MKVRLLEEISEEALNAGQDYVVASLEITKSYRNYRIYSDIRESPILFSWDLFRIVDHDIPAVWEFHYNNERNFMKICPPSWSVMGFWERYFDAEPEAIKIFSDELKIIEEQS